MALLPNFPISGDDYTVGTITTVAGSKDFNTKDAYLQSYGAVQAGDHIYIAPAGKFLIIASITGENSGTLTDPCPEDCAVTDADLRIIFKTASSRLQGRTAMLIERLSKGCLASLAELSPKEGQIFRATGVEGQLEAVDNTADNVIETDTRKFMTAKDRQSIDNVVKRVDGLTTDNVPETDTHKYFPADFNADDLPETDEHKVMTAAERDKIASIAKNYLPIDERDKITKQIDDRFNACVTDSRTVGWTQVETSADGFRTLPSGYFMHGFLGVTGTRFVLTGVQPQLYIENRGWFPLGGW